MIITNIIENPKPCGSKRPCLFLEKEFYILLNGTILEINMSGNEIWLTILRGAVEKAIDRMLSDESLSLYRIFFENMSPAIRNSDDAIFGFIYGHVFGSLETIFRTVNRQPTNEEMNEIVNAINKRTLEIKSRIYQTET